MFASDRPIRERTLAHIQTDGWLGTNGTSVWFDAYGTEPCKALALFAQQLLRRKMQGEAGSLSDLAVDFQRGLVALRHMLDDG